VAEEVEATGSSSTGLQGGGAGAQAAAAALSFASASREKADAFLDDQRTLIANQNRMLHLQMEEMRAEEPYKLSHFRLRRFSDFAKAAFEFSVGLLALAVVAAAGVMVWNAAHDDGLVVEAFSVPPDLAAQGQTGQVVAGAMLDELAAMQAQSNSGRLAGSYSNNWGDDLKVEIPETGISLGEVNRYLHRWLGHQTLISGAVVHTPTGLSVTTRAGAQGSERVSGGASDLDTLIRQAAEAVYRQTQPYRYGVYLGNHGRVAESRAWYERNAANGPVLERAWASGIGLTNNYLFSARVPEVEAAAQEAVRLKPDFGWGWGSLMQASVGLGRLEAALTAGRNELRLTPTETDITPQGAKAQVDGTNIVIHQLTGDYLAALRGIAAAHPGISLTDPSAGMAQELRWGGGGTPRLRIVSFPYTVGSVFSALHDLTAARRIISETAEFQAVLQDMEAGRQDRADMAELVTQAFRLLALNIAQQAEDWPQVRAEAEAMEAAEPRLDAVYASPGFYLPVEVWPAKAEALARGGDFGAAHALIDRTPSDCDLCLRARARIDALEGNFGGADYWFAKAVAAAPSIPFAFEDWGRSLLARGKPDDAIAQFALANRRGPHFADALEGWGEALMAKNQSHLALAKFAEADKYAPNWGRLHMKWGEALVYAGKPAEAKAQFARAAQLDLTASEKAELARVQP